jgi:hypothetical protein
MKATDLIGLPKGADWGDEARKRRRTGEGFPL